jgi:hypothetical protein
VPIIASSDRKNVVGESSGSVMLRKIYHPDAPSMRAA